MNTPTDPTAAPVAEPPHAPCSESAEGTIEPTSGQAAPPDDAGAFRSEPEEFTTEGGDDEEWEEVPVGEDAGADGTVGVADSGTRRVRRRRRRQAKLDSVELRLQGRRAMCKRGADIAPNMGMQVKLRILKSYIESKGGLAGKDNDDLTQVVINETPKLADRKRVLEAAASPGPDFVRDELRLIILTVLLQEETHSTTEQRLYEKVIEYEKALVKRSKSLDFTELKKSDPDRWHHLDTYRIVLEAAWANDGVVSVDEARLLGVLRKHLNVTPEEHWLIGALLKRFPKEKCALHTPDEINDARKELQRQGLVWNYKSDDDQNIDVIPAEIADVIRRDYAGLELQTVNYRRLLSHDAILLSDLRNVLQKNGIDRSGNKADLIERVVASEVNPSAVLNELDKEKLATMSAGFALRSSGSKAELISRLIDFYDDLTFEERVTKDAREEWYGNYELLARRAYAELRAKKVITKDLEIEHMFEDATAFLFETRLRVPCDMSRKDNRADGKLLLDNDQCILLDCKSAEAPVNLQDYLETQFDGYLRKERENNKHPIGFLVIAPAFTPQSISLAYKYKAKTNWDIALVTAEGLRHLADRWVVTSPDKPFPVRLLNHTGIIDRDRAEVILSLV